MEAIEGAVAEETRRHVTAFGSIEEMRNKGVPLIPFETVGRIDPDALDLRKERAWVKEPPFANNRRSLPLTNSSAWTSVRSSHGTGRPSA